MRFGSVVTGSLGATAVAGLAIWLGLEHQAANRLREANAGLRQQLDQMGGLAAENERLSNVVAQASRSRSGSEEQMKELLRLRGEVGVLRQQSKELETLREENRQARAALASSLKTHSATPAGGPTTASYWPRDSWAFAGYASPDAALQSFIWAASKGDVKTAISGTTGEFQKQLEKVLEGKSEGEASTMSIAKFASLKSILVVNREVQADDTVALTVPFDWENGTSPRKFLVKKVGTEWKFSGFAQ